MSNLRFVVTDRLTSRKDAAFCDINDAFLWVGTEEYPERFIVWDSQDECECSQPRSIPKKRTTLLERLGKQTMKTKQKENK